MALQNPFPFLRNFDTTPGQDSKHSALLSLNEAGFGQNNPRSTNSKTDDCSGSRNIQNNRRHRSLGMITPTQAHDVNNHRYKFYGQRKQTA